MYKFWISLIFSLFFVSMLPDSVVTEDILNYYEVWGSRAPFLEWQLKEQIELVSKSWFMALSSLDFNLFQVVNIFILTWLTIYLRSKIFGYSRKISIFLVLLTPSTFVSFGYTWRQTFAFLVFISFWLIYTRKLKLISLIIPVSIHSSSILFWMSKVVSKIGKGNFYKFSLITFTIIGTLFIYKIPFFRTFQGDLKSFSFIGWSVYSLLTIILYYKFFNHLDFSSRVIVDVFSCILIISILAVSSPVIISRLTFPLLFFSYPKYTSSFNILIFRLFMFVNLILYLRLF